MFKVTFSTLLAFVYVMSPISLYAQDRGGYVNDPEFKTVTPTQSTVIEPLPLPTANTAQPFNNSTDTSPTPPTGPTVDQIWAAPPTSKTPGTINTANINNAVIAKTEVEKQLSPPQDASLVWQSVFIKNLVGGDGTLTLLTDDKSTASKIEETVKVDQAVSLALANNPEVKATLEAVRSKELDKFAAYSQFLPVAQLDLATGRERSRPASYNDSLGNRVTDNTHDRRDRVLTLRQPLVDLGYLADILTSYDRQDIANYERKDTQDRIAADSVNAYLGLIQSRISILLADQYKGYLDDLADKMRLRVEGGGASSSDLDRILSRASQAENAKVEADSQYQTSLLELQRLTGAVPLKIKVPDVMAPDVPESLEAALASAYQGNASYLSALKKIDAANHDRDRAYSALAPKVYAQYSSGYSFDSGGAANGNPIDGVYPTQRTDSAMLIAQWTLNGGVPIASGLSASARARQMSMLSLDTRQKMDQGIRVSYSALTTSKERLEVLQKTVEANERVIKGFEEQYKNGTRSAFELLDAYEQLYNSRLNLMRVIFAYSQASYQVHLQMGDIVPSVVKTRDQ